MCDALLINLSQACQNKGVSPKSERKLHNIFDNMEAWLPMDISKRLKPAIPAAHMPPLSPDRMQEIVEPYMASVWSELDANWTQALISRCGTVCQLSVFATYQPAVRSRSPYQTRLLLHSGLTLRHPHHASVIILTLTALKVANLYSTLPAHLAQHHNTGQVLLTNYLYC